MKTVIQDLMEMLSVDAQSAVKIQLMHLLDVDAEIAEQIKETIELGGLDLAQCSQREFDDAVARFDGVNHQ